MLIDSHSHLFDKQFDADREAVTLRMKEVGVETITVGTSYAESVQAVALAEKYCESGEDGYKMWATIGQHPTDQVDEIFDIDKYRELAKSKFVVGLGECGLDYTQSKFSKLPLEEEKLRQRALFIEQIELAIELDKPMMLHIRSAPNTVDAYEDAYSIMSEYIKVHGKKLRGTVHFFTGTLEVARKFWAIGFATSFPGVITFTTQYDEVVKAVPEDLYLIETDSPYVLPEPYRSQARKGQVSSRNEPIYVLEVAKRVAELRGVSLDEVVAQSGANTRRVFAL